MIELYEAYREQMLVFSLEQIEAEHINANLALIYEDVLFVEMIKPDMAIPKDMQQINTYTCCFRDGK